MTNNEYIKQLFQKEGIYEVGFAAVRHALPYAISIVVPLSRFVIDQIQDAPTYEYFHHYRTVNAYIDRCLLRCGLEIDRLGYSYLCVGASQSTGGCQSYFPHKTAARLAGLGYIGKSTLFLSERYGPAVRLGTILTDMPFQTGTPLSKDCGVCNQCKTACPALAIRGQNYREDLPRAALFDAEACSQYMKQQFQKIGRGVVCGICIRQCPKYQNANRRE